MVATPWSIAQHAADNRTDDHWIIFVDASTPGLDPPPELLRVRDQADLTVCIDDTESTDVVAVIARAWKKWLHAHEP